MDGGIRAELAIPASEACPVAAASGATGTTIDGVSRSAGTDPAGDVVEEFVVDAPDHSPVESMADLAPVFASGHTAVYRFGRAPDRECPCAEIERLGCPPFDVRAREGSLHLTFHAPDVETLRTAIRAIRSGYPGTDVTRLLRSSGDRAGEDLVFVDRGRLTERQLEVLRTAHDMGYFDHPKGANAGEVAASLGITTSTFTEHLSAAQGKLLSAILDG